MPGHILEAMSHFVSMLFFTTSSGACILLGGLLAKIERIRPLWLEQELRHTIIAFGGGVLMAAIAFVLVPEGQEYFRSPTLGAVIFLSGGIVFMLVERHLAAKKQELPQTLAMLLDFIPESLAMGGMFALGSVSAPLLALLIGLQNVPEGFNAYREILAASDNRTQRTLSIMFLMMLPGPIAGLLGWYIAPGFPEFIGATMLFASGGILYLIFQDIAPQSRLERHWAPTFGAVVGFCLTWLANLLVTGH
jgi:ZIP family zinc transporter